MYVFAQLVRIVVLLISIIWIAMGLATVFGSDVGFEPTAGWFQIVLGLLLGSVMGFSIWKSHQDRRPGGPT